jgi:hypothetical protein
MPATFRSVRQVTPSAPPFTMSDCWNSVALRFCSSVALWLCSSVVLWFSPLPPVALQLCGSDFCPLYRITVVVFPLEAIEPCELRKRPGATQEGEEWNWRCRWTR